MGGEFISTLNSSLQNASPGLFVSQRPKILIATDAWHPQVNGVVRTLTHVAERLRRLHSCDVEVVSPSSFTLYPNPIYPEVQLAFPRIHSMEDIFDKAHPQGLYIASEGPVGIQMRRVALRRQVPFTTGYHTKFPEYLSRRLMIPEAFSYKYLKWFHGRSNCILVPTESVANELRNRGFKNVKVWTRGVESHKFFVTAQDQKDELLPEKYKRPIFLNVGRVSHEKNLEAFLDLDLPGTKLIVGDGPYKQFLEKKYSSQLQAKKIVFVGSKQGEELAKYYSASDVFVFPSKFDTFGLVMAEALASGLPVAAFPVTGPIDVVGKSNCGFLDSDLQKAASNAYKAIKVEKITSAECRKFALENYSWERTAQIFLENLPLIMH